MKRSTFKTFFALFVFLFARLLAGEQTFTTFVDPDPSAPLQQQNIALKVDKKDTPVTWFLFVDTAQRTPEGLFQPAARRHYILLFDLVFSSPDDLLQARKDAMTFLEKLGNDDLVSVAGISRKSGLRFYCTFTMDRSKIIAGFNALGKETSPDWMEGPEGYFYSTKFSSASAEVSLLPDADFLQQVKTLVPSDPKKNDPRPAFVQGIVDLSFYLSNVDGRKNILLFSPGFNTEGIKRSSSDIEVPELVMRETSEEEQLEQQRQQADRSQGPSFDVERVPEFIAGSDSHVHVFTKADNDFYKALANSTGGIYSTKSSGASEEISKILATDSRYYVVAWDGKTEKEFKSLHSVKIEASGKVIANQQRIAPKASADYAPIEKKLNVSEAIYRDYSPLPEMHFWTDFLLENNVAQVPCFLQISGKDILKRDLSDLTLEFYGAVIGTNNQVLDSASIPIRLDLKNKSLKERLSGSGLKAWNVLFSREEPVLVRSVVANWKTGEMYTFTGQLEISNSNLVNSSVFFPALNLDWIIWPTPSDPQTRRGVNVKFPYVVGYDLFFPDLAPEIASDEKGRFFYFKIYNRPSDAKNPPIHIRLVDDKSQPVEITDFSLGQKPNPLDQNGVELFWKILSLPKVAPGSYIFQVDVTDPVTGKHLRGETPLQVR